MPTRKYLPKKAYGLVIILLAGLFLSACSSLAPVQNMPEQAIPSGLTMAQIKDSIIVAGKKRGWTMTPMKAGVIKASHSARGHVANVEVRYDLKHYQIHSLDSTNLDYQNGMINHNYNRWVNNLKVDIQRQLSKQAQ